MPALVERAYWYGAHSFSNAAMNCLAKILATSLSNELPVAIPLTPPSGFVKAVSLAPIRASEISAGTLARQTRDGLQQQLHGVCIV